MVLKQLHLANFRNYATASFCLNPAGNLVIAPNGFGKTNLLEAIAYCGLGKSVRFHRDDEVLKKGSDEFGVNGDFLNDSGLELKIQIAWRERRKFLKIDGDPIRQLSKLYERVKVVYAAPDDTMLVDGSPSSRRKYFDLCVSQIYPAYVGLLRDYLHVVQQRNSLLKNSFAPLVKKSWDRRFCELLLEVLDYRNRYLAEVNKALAQSYPEVLEPVKSLQLVYRPQTQQGYPDSLEKMEELVASLEPMEKNAQRGLCGAHIDDYEFCLNGYNLKTFGSQGQKRITVIVLRLIQAALIENLTGIRPILLFDDVLAELDAPNARRIADFVDQRYQIFIASPREELSAQWPGLEPLNFEETAS
ncbi:MAG: DNA replication and repair protein RecF [Candidatus Cloacimonadaceae bacterium]|nr:DNA replication and repair protein RecF [Candidatus Cloacimonadota bacterium]MDX9949678.1 DNA replication and repair protein RecF [Candidatus Syntrophosphaera sp.]NLN85794.1 DNA replication and repair protein RecF [Candidatus Cloacimonadota bacterium]